MIEIFIAKEIKLIKIPNGEIDEDFIMLIGLRISILKNKEVFTSIND